MGDDAVDFIGGSERVCLWPFNDIADEVVNPCVAVVGDGNIGIGVEGGL